jgi:hypothetical protein
VSRVPARLASKLIRRSIELRSMYRLAASQVGEPGLRTVLQENAVTLDQVVNELLAQHKASTHVDQQNPPLSVSHSLSQWWATHAAHHGDGAWIRQLARREAAFLAVFEQAIVICDGELELVLRRQMPRLRGIDLDMHGLTKAARCSL